jgi:hypothetical protein
MDDSGKMSLEGIRAFLAASEPVQFAGQKREEIYRWVEQTLREQDYQRLGRSERGFGTAVCGEDDGAQPGTGDPSDSNL